MNQDLINKLCAPFPYDEVEAKIQVVSNDKTKGMAVFYIDSRAIQKRLDEAAGPFNWSNSFTPWQDKAQICGISIFNTERNEWVTKHDGADNSDIEAVKGGLTDAFKRSAVLWGIGRYLYQIDGVWVEVEQRGRGSYIKDSQQGKLKAAYEAAVKKIFNGAVVSGTQNQSTVVTPPTQQPIKPAAAPPAVTEAPTTSNTKPSTPQTSAGKAASKPATPPASDFTVHSMKPSGKGSQLLELYNNSGEIISAYVKSGEPGIAVGTCLRNVKIEAKSGTFGKYNLIAGYELAAA